MAGPNPESTGVVRPTNSGVGSDPIFKMKFLHTRRLTTESSRNASIGRDALLEPTPIEIPAATEFPEPMIRREYRTIDLKKLIPNEVN